MRAEGEGWTLIQGDCPAALAELADNSVDSVVTDPPYELAFMSRHWDATGIAYNVDLWREVLRVLKPGGHLLAFGGTRTYHRMVCAIEDAGFEVRDCIQWLYGSGFPKSKNVGAVLGLEPTAIGSALKPSHEPIVLARKPLAGPTIAAQVLATGTGALNVDACRVTTVENLGRSNHVGPYSSERTWSVSPTKGIDNTDNPPSGRWPSNLVLSHAPGCVRTGVKRVKASSGEGSTSPKFTGMNKWQDERRPIQHYADADGLETVDAWTCVDGCPVQSLDSQARERESGGFPSRHGIKNTGYDDAGVYGTFRGADTGREKLHASEGSASRFFPVFAYEADDFVPWLYCAKASRREREAGLEGMEARETWRHNQDGRDTSNPKNVIGAGAKARMERGEPAVIPSRNTHPCVKPLTLMSWLCRLVTPPGGVVLDPFTGSGSTGCAALREGFRFIGVEREAEYIEIAQRRLDYILSQRPAATQTRLAV